MGGAQPTPGQVARQVPEEEEPEAARPTQGAEERGTPAPATLPLWRVLEAVLGLVALGLALATVWAWRIRRR
jgi:hypothetical protein